MRKNESVTNKILFLLKKSKLKRKGPGKEESTQKLRLKKHVMEIFVGRNFHG